MNPYTFNDYRDLISAFLQQKIGRGSKVQLARELNCQPGYVSQVLTKSKIHFSPENMVKIGNFLGLTSPQQDFLLMLLLFERAGSEELRAYYDNKIRGLQKEHLRPEKQISETGQVLDETKKAVYYSHWSYCAVHMAVSIEGIQKTELISSKLGLSQEMTEKVLGFLEETALITKTKGRYQIGKTRIHLRADSPLVKTHHLNYRFRAIQSLEAENNFDLHYSSVLVLAKKDALKIRELVLKLLAEKEKILLPSQNEELICLNVDLFGL